MKFRCERCLEEDVNLYLRTNGTTVCEECFTELERLQCLLVLARSNGDADHVIVLMEQIKKLKDA